MEDAGIGVRGVRLGEAPAYASVRAWLLAHEGRSHEARLEMAKTAGASAVLRASVHVELGDHEEAFRVLEESVRVRDQDVVYLKVSPSLDAFRNDPRIEKLCRMVGLAGCTSASGGV